MALDYGAVINDAVGTTDVNSLSHPIDMEKQTKLMDPTSYMYLTLMRKLRKSMGVKQMKHEYRQRRLIPNFTTIKTAQAVGAASITVDDPTRIKTDMLVFLPRTDDLLLVQGVTDATGVCTIVKATTGNGTLPHATVVGDKVVILLESHAEGEAVPAAYTTTSTNKFDYVMQSDRAVASTDIEDTVGHYDDRERKRRIDLKQAYIEYERDENVLHYVGQTAREIVSASGRRRHCMGGCFEKLVTNKIDLAFAGGILTFETCVQLVGETKKHGQSSAYKIGIWGTNGWNAISGWPKDSLRRNNVLEKKWGWRVNLLVTGYGDMNVLFDPVLSLERGLEDRAVILDPKMPQHLHLRNKRVKIYKNKGARADIHNTTDVISGTFGQKLEWEELGAQIEGIGAV